jgi:hypothetical protein
MMRLLYSDDYEPWRVRWHKEGTLQPMINFVKTIDAHWKAINGCGGGMVLLTEQNFPLHYMQMSRVMWITVILLFPFDQGANLGYYTCLVMFMLVVSYFSLDLISTELENPFGIHEHAIDLMALFTRIERVSAAIVTDCGQNLGGGADDDDDTNDGAAAAAAAAKGTSMDDGAAGDLPSSLERYDAALIVDPLAEGRTTAEIRRAAISKHFRRKKNGAVVVDDFREDQGQDAV